MRYRCYRCKKGVAEWSFDQCARCGFSGPDTRWWWTRLVDWVKGLRA